MSFPLVLCLILDNEPTNSYKPFEKLCKDTKNKTYPKKEKEKYAFFNIIMQELMTMIVYQICFDTIILLIK